MNLAYPLHFDGRGRTATAGDEAHIRQMIEQLIFTSPGERLNRPDFGSGLDQLVFAPNSPELAATVQFTVQASIQYWLGDLIDIQDLEVTADDSTLTVTLQYSIRKDDTAQKVTFTRGR